METLRHKPSAFWRLDDSSPFQDYSGYNRSGTMGSSEEKGVSLSADSLYSQTFERSRVGTFYSPVFQDGQEKVPFSLGAIVRLIRKSEGFVAPVYAENYVYNPKPQVSLTAFSSQDGTPSRDTTITANGYATFAATSKISVAGDLRALMSSNMPVSGGETIYASAMVRFQRETTLRVELFESTTSGATYPSKVWTVPANTWVKVGYERVTAPNATQIVGVQIVAVNVPAGEKYNVIDYFLTKGPEKNFFDGETPGYYWGGTRFESVSKTRTDVADVNYSVNPGFSDNTYGFQVIGAGGTSYTRMTDGGVSGNTYGRVVANSGTGGGAGMVTTYVPPGDYYVSFWVRSSAGIGANRFYLEGTAAQYTTILERNDTSVVPANTWFNYRIRLRVGLGGTLKPGINYGVSSADGTTIDYDSFVVRKASYEYFDETTPGAAVDGVDSSKYFFMRPSNGEVQILGNIGYLDGLTINGTTVSFSTRYRNTGFAKASYNLEVEKRVELVGVHTDKKNSLYVDGELVAEVDITKEQQEDKFVQIDSNLWSGNTESSQGIQANNYSVFARQLSSENVMSIYKANSRWSEANVPAMYGGVDVPVDASIRRAFINTEWSTSEDWRSATLIGTDSDGDQLRTSSSGGTWIDAVDLYTGDQPLPINSVNLWWEGEGLSVDTSVDGTTWVPATRGRNLTNIPTGFDPTNKVLYIRLKLSGENSYVDYLRVHGYNTNTSVSGGRTVTYNNPVTPLDSSIPGETSDDWGIRVDASGSFTLSPDTSGVPMPVRTLEVWMKPDKTSVVSYDFSGAASFQNGFASGTTVPGGQWTIYHLIFSSDRTTAISFNQVVGQIGKVAVYPTALTASEVSDVVASYTGVKRIKQDGSGVIAVAEPATSTVVYAADWEIQAS